MSTIALTQTHETAEVMPREHYLNSSYGIKSWLLTHDHKRICILSDADFALIIRGFTKAPNWQ